ncbi:MAG TPA: transglycosylase domain-containing protein [Candidatus Limnocylindrales bacterium]|nr:transglycosylase domain-containing protein [Candidatus Limnocylindrales bacterium]
MQTSLARRQRHRRATGRGRPRGSSTVRRVAIAIPIILFAVFVLVGLAGLMGVAAAYNYYSQGLPDPKDTLSGLTFDQQTVLTDRTGKVKLASLGEFKREVVTFDEIPPEMLDATTAIEDKDFWSNPGFDLFGFVSATLDTLNGRPRGGSTITQQLVRARLLPEAAFQGSREERKVREIIQSLRLTQAYPGEDGKREIITAYLNQNFYGNQSYGVKAAARTYFNKDLKDLTLAQFAVLAAIPQSPSAFDLVKNAEENCTVTVKAGADCPDNKTVLQVPTTAEVYQRRNYILDLMKTRSPLSGAAHSPQDYEAAKAEPLILAPPPGVQWLAPHFVWQVRTQLAGIVCPNKPIDECSEIDTGGYRVTTTLDWKMQTTTEKWLYAAARAPNLNDTTARLKNLKIPSKDWGWLRNLSGKNLNNGAAGIIDYRTGEVLAYAGSASYTAKGTKKFQPKFDVLSDGWRQPGSSIKPINYSIGIEDRTMTAATLFMDVTTDFGGKFIPTQADHYERGPVRLRSALQFSLNIPSIKASLLTGLDRFYKRAQDFGIHWVPKSVPVTSMGIGTIEVHPIDMISAYGAIANGGKLMPRTMILKVTDANGNVVWPDASTASKAKTVISPQTAYIMTDILAGNTEPKTNPFWGEWAVYDKTTRRPAAYKTGTTNDNRDVHAYGFLAPPKDPDAPALVVGVWMGNSDNSPDTDTLSLGSSAPLWSRIITDVSKGTPIAQFKPPKGLVTEAVDAFTGFAPGPYTSKTFDELFIPGTEPTETDDFHRSIDIDSASGLLWQEGCVGPMKTVGVLDFSHVESNEPNWQRYDNGWLRRAARGAGVGGGPKGSRTSYFYGGFPAFYPFGRSWGGKFAPTELCPLAPEPTPTPCDNPFGLFCPPPSGEPTPTPTDSHGPGKTPKP